MGRRSKAWGELGLPPLRQYWRECNRYDRETLARQRRYRKTYDKKRPKCRCDAYKFPHRPGGGLCRYPDPPAVSWREREAAEVAERVQDYIAQRGEPRTMTLDELAAWLSKSHRPYRKRYTGILRQICRANGLNPIRDRALIAKLLPRVLWQAKSIHRDCPWKWKYRNIEVETLDGDAIRVTGNYQTAGPAM